MDTYRGHNGLFSRVFLYVLASLVVGLGVGCDSGVVTPSIPSVASVPASVGSSLLQCDIAQGFSSTSSGGCGAVGEPCCDDLSHPDQPVCELATYCTGGCCAPCGYFGEPCCPAGSLTEPNNGGCLVPLTCHLGMCSAT